MCSQLKLSVLSVILISIFMLTGSYLFAQRYLIHNYTEESGLPSSTVFCMTQDASGKMWYGTRNGIAVYGRFTLGILHN